MTVRSRQPLTGTRSKGPLSRAQEAQWNRIQEEMLAPTGEPSDLSSWGRRCQRPRYLRWYMSLTRQYRRMSPGKRKDALRWFLDNNPRRGDCDIVLMVIQKVCGWKP